MTIYVLIAENEKRNTINSVLHNMFIGVDFLRS